MDWYRTIEEEIFGEKGWARLSADKKDIADKVLSWCVENKSEIPEGKIYKALWSDKVIDELDKELKSTDGHGIAYYMRKNRKRELYDRRTMIFALLYTITNCTASSLAERYGYHHTTVLHALSTNKNLCDTDREYKEKYVDLVTKINERCERLLM